MLSSFPRFIVFLAAVCLCPLSAGDFTLPLSVKNGQVDRLVLGCRAGAGDGYDKGIDIYVPPIGIGCGIVGFLTRPDAKDMLYKDVRADTRPQAWRISCRPAGKPLQFAWKTDELPEDTAFTIRLDKGKTVDMRAIQRIIVSKPGILTITATTPAPKN